MSLPDGPVAELSNYLHGSIKLITGIAAGAKRRRCSSLLSVLCKRSRNLVTYWLCQKASIPGHWSPARNCLPNAHFLLQPCSGLSFSSMGLCLYLQTRCVWCREHETKFLVRTLVSNLRVGANWRSVIGAMARAVVMHREGPKVPKARLDAAATAASEAYHVGMLC